MSSVGNDFQNQRMVFIDDVNAKRKNGGRHTMISVENLIIVSIYFAVRHCIEATWLNDRDQFLFQMKNGSRTTTFRMIVWLLHYFPIIYNRNLAPTTGFHLQN